VKKLHARCCDCSQSFGSSAHLGAGEGTGVETGTSAGDASSDEGVLLSELSSSEVSGDGVGEVSTSLGEALDGNGASGGVEFEALGRTFTSSCRRMVWNRASFAD